MRKIVKMPEPRAFTEHKLSEGALYENIPSRCKNELREQLVMEQRGLCCYCLNRIRPGDGRTVPPMKIAHWHSQTLHDDEQLVYLNLLGACMGNEKNLPSHCDTSQGDRDIRYNPADPAHHIETRIKYLSDGTVHSDETEFQAELENVLNLNAKFMIGRRRDVLEDFQESLGQRTLMDENWEELLSDWNGNAHSGELRPYCQIVVDYIRKKLHRL